MFERNVAAAVEQAAVSVELSLDDGSVAAGRLLIPASRTVFDLLNGPAVFFEFEPFEGERRFIAKSALKAVKLLAGSKPQAGLQKARDLDGFDPHAILGIKAASPWEDVRAAYVALAKTYHPDRYETAQLPREVTDYLTGMSRRINAAYAALETARQSQRVATERRVSAVYVSPRNA